MPCYELVWDVTLCSAAKRVARGRAVETLA